MAPMAQTVLLGLPVLPVLLELPGILEVVPDVPVLLLLEEAVSTPAVEAPPQPLSRAPTISPTGTHLQTPKFCISLDSRLKSSCPVSSDRQRLSIVKSAICGPASFSPYISSSYRQKDRRSDTDFEPRLLPGADRIVDAAVGFRPNA